VLLCGLLNLLSSLGGGDDAAVLAGADDIANGTGDDEDGLEDIVGYY
jgi:hypothetical protein